MPGAAYPAPMTRKTQKRDNDYYLGLLEKAAPAVYAQYRAGHFKSASAAILAGGVRQAPQQIHALLRAWKKASPTERAEFLSKIGASSSAGTSPAASPAPTSIVTPNRRLTEATKKRLLALYPPGSGRYDGFPTEKVMTALGLPTHDTSLGMAMRRNTSLQLDLIRELEVWLPVEEARRRGV